MTDKNAKGLFPTFRDNITLVPKLRRNLGGITNNLGRRQILVVKSRDMLLDLDKSFRGQNRHPTKKRI